MPGLILARQGERIGQRSGRGFFPGSLPLGDWVARIAAGEAVIGLFIELILIATFSKRFLGN